MRDPNVINAAVDSSNIAEYDIDNEASLRLYLLMFLGDGTISSLDKQNKVRQVKNRLRKRLDDMFKKMRKQIYGRKMVAEFQQDNSEDKSVTSSTSGQSVVASQPDDDYNDDHGEIGEGEENEGGNRADSPASKNKRQQNTEDFDDVLDFGHYGHINTGLFHHYDV